jgi:hypothetical protein
VEGYLRGKKKLNALLVGVGADQYDPFGGALCASSPFELGELLERQGKDYSMTILDINEKALKEPETRKRIFTCPGDRGKGTPISETFKRKRKEGEIKFVKGDVVTADLGPNGPFDLVQCLNVLYYIPREGNTAEENNNSTILAVWNMARNVSKGGVMLLNDPLFCDKEGNLTGTVQYLVNGPLRDEMHITLEKVLPYNPRKAYLFFKKT